MLPLIAYFALQRVPICIGSSLFCLMKDYFAQLGIAMLLKYLITVLHNYTALL